MSKYKVGDKIVLTVTSTNEMGCLPCYVLNDDLILSKQDIDKYTEPLSTYTEQARADGAETAWELARKIFDMETNDIEDIFITEDAWNLGTVLNNYTYAEAAAKVAEWEKVKEIKVGDILEDRDEGNKVIVTNLKGQVICILWDDGRIGTTYIESAKGIFRNTGRHIDIDSFLKQIGEE